MIMRSDQEDTNGGESNASEIAANDMQEPYFIWLSDHTEDSQNVERVLVHSYLQTGPNFAWKNATDN